MGFALSAARTSLDAVLRRAIVGHPRRSRLEPYQIRLMPKVSSRGSELITGMS